MFIHIEQMNSVLTLAYCVVLDSTRLTSYYPFLLIQKEITTRVWVEQQENIDPPLNPWCLYIWQGASGPYK